MPVLQADDEADESSDAEAQDMKVRCLIFSVLDAHAVNAIGFQDDDELYPPKQTSKQAPKQTGGHKKPSIKAVSLIHGTAFHDSTILGEMAHEQAAGRKSAPYRPQIARMVVGAKPVRSVAPTQS